MTGKRIGQIRRRRTAEIAALLQAGVHPATRRPLDRDHHCADCAHLVTTPFATDTRYGCDLAPPKLRVRLSWPACDRFQPDHRKSPTIGG